MNNLNTMRQQRQDVAERSYERTKAQATIWWAAMVEAFLPWDLHMFVSCEQADEYVARNGRNQQPWEAAEGSNGTKFREQTLSASLQGATYWSDELKATKAVDLGYWHYVGQNLS